VTKKGKDTEIISVSLPESTAEEMDELVGEMGYPSRSELVRDAVRALIKSKQDMESLEGTVEGVMILLYDHKAAHDVSEIRHNHMGLFRSFMHSDFDSRDCGPDEVACKCCEVLMFSGGAQDVRKARNSFRTTKHVEQSLVFLA
jgi:metal-responsive CopG/Arc/MetJ family transcriptional regulator